MMGSISHEFYLLKHGMKKNQIVRRCWTEMARKIQVSSRIDGSPYKKGTPCKETVLQGQKTKEKQKQPQTKDDIQTKEISLYHPYTSTCFELFLQS